MKKIFLAFTAILAGMFMCTTTGCHEPELPSLESVRVLSVSVGKAAGYAFSIANTDAAVINIINEVFKTLKESIPEDDASFADTWATKIESEIAKYVSLGKLNDLQAFTVKTTLSLCASGLDYLFKIHPTWRQYSNLTGAAITGFFEGFSSVEEGIATGALSVAKGIKDPSVDTDAYSYFIKIRENKAKPKQTKK